MSIDQDPEHPGDHNHENRSDSEQAEVGSGTQMSPDANKAESVSPTALIGEVSLSETSQSNECGDETEYFSPTESIRDSSSTRQAQDEALETDSDKLPEEATQEDSEILSDCRENGSVPLGSDDRSESNMRSTEISQGSHDEPHSVDKPESELLNPDEAAIVEEQGLAKVDVVVESNVEILQSANFGHSSLESQISLVDENSASNPQEISRNLNHDDTTEHSMASPPPNADDPSTTRTSKSAQEGGICEENIADERSGQVLSSSDRSPWSGSEASDGDSDVGSLEASLIDVDDENEEADSPLLSPSDRRQNQRLHNSQRFSSSPSMLPTASSSLDMSLNGRISPHPGLTETALLPDGNVMDAEDDDEQNHFGQLRPSIIVELPSTKNTNTDSVHFRARHTPGECMVECHPLWEVAENLKKADTEEMVCDAIPQPDELDMTEPRNFHWSNWLDAVHKLGIALRSATAARRWPNSAKILSFVLYLQDRCHGGRIRISESCLQAMVISSCCVTASVALEALSRMSRNMFLVNEAQEVQRKLVLMCVDTALGGESKPPPDGSSFLVKALASSTAQNIRNVSDFEIRPIDHDYLLDHTVPAPNGVGVTSASHSPEKAEKQQPVVVEGSLVESAIKKGMNSAIRALRLPKWALAAAKLRTRWYCAMVGRAGGAEAAVICRLNGAAAALRLMDVQRGQGPAIRFQSSPGVRPPAKRLIFDFLCREAIAILDTPLASPALLASAAAAILAVVDSQVAAKEPMRLWPQDLQSRIRIVRLISRFASLLSHGLSQGRINSVTKALRCLLCVLIRQRKGSNQFFGPDHDPLIVDQQTAALLSTTGVWDVAAQVEMSWFLPSVTGMFVENMSTTYKAVISNSSSSKGVIDADALAGPLSVTDRMFAAVESLPHRRLGAVRSDTVQPSFALAAEMIQLALKQPGVLPPRPSRALASLTMRILRSWWLYGAAPGQQLPWVESMVSALRKALDSRRLHPEGLWVLITSGDGIEGLIEPLGEVVILCLVRELLSRKNLTLDVSTDCDDAMGIMVKPHTDLAHVREALSVLLDSDPLLVDIASHEFVDLLLGAAEAMASSDKLQAKRGFNMLCVGLELGSPVVKRCRPAVAVEVMEWLRAALDAVGNIDNIDQGQFVVASLKLLDLGPRLAPILTCHASLANSIKNVVEMVGDSVSGSSLECRVAIRQFLDVLEALIGRPLNSAFFEFHSDAWERILSPAAVSWVWWLTLDKLSQEAQLSKSSKHKQVAADKLLIRALQIGIRVMSRCHLLFSDLLQKVIRQSCTHRSHLLVVGRHIAEANVREEVRGSAQAVGVHIVTGWESAPNADSGLFVDWVLQCAPTALNYPSKMDLLHSRLSHALVLREPAVITINEKTFWSDSVKGLDVLSRGSWGRFRILIVGDQSQQSSDASSTSSSHQDGRFTLLETVRFMRERDVSSTSDKPASNALQTTNSAGVPAGGTSQDRDSGENADLRPSSPSLWSATPFSPRHPHIRQASIPPKHVEVIAWLAEFVEESISRGVLCIAAGSGGGLLPALPNSTEDDNQGSPELDGEDVIKWVGVAYGLAFRLRYKGLPPLCLPLLRLLCRGGPYDKDAQVLSSEMQWRLGLVSSASGHGSGPDQASVEHLGFQDVLQLLTNQSLQVFRDGFVSVVPTSCIGHLNPSELCIAMSGPAQIGIEDFIQSSSSTNLADRRSHLVQWLWSWLRAADTVMVSKFVFLVAGTTAMVGGITVMCDESAPGVYSKPRNKELYLPDVSDQETLGQALFLAVNGSIDVATFQSLAS